MDRASARPLVLVSNRGPVTFAEDGSMSRGTGGLVTALTGLASYRDATWIASAMTDGDAQRAEEAGDRPFMVRTPPGGGHHARLGASAQRAYDRLDTSVANPMPRLIPHHLRALSN